MTQYLINLTEDLIGKYNFHKVVKTKALDFKQFGKHIEVTLLCNDVEIWAAETLGRVLGDLTTNEVTMNPLVDPGHSYNGSCKDLLRDIVSRCLAHVIRDMLSPGQTNTNVPRSKFFSEPMTET